MRTPLLTGWTHQGQVKVKVLALQGTKLHIPSLCQFVTVCHMRNLNHLGLIPRVLNDFQRGIEGSGSSRHCHLEAVPHFCKPVRTSSVRDPAIPLG